VREGHTGIQQTAAESTLFAPQSRGRFSRVAIPKRSYMQECMRWLVFSPKNVIHLKPMLSTQVWSVE